MLQKKRDILNRIQDREKNQIDPLVFVPAVFTPEEIKSPEKIRGSASIDLRLGTWFLTSQSTRLAVLDISRPTRLDLAFESLLERRPTTDKEREYQNAAKRVRDEIGRLAQPNCPTKQTHVRLGDDFVLHPRAFALASTLEWMRIPTDMAGYVTGRSSWGRRGLVIATAVGVHPGFTGCLTLELANLGDIPIVIRPGMTVAQLFLHSTPPAGGPKDIDGSNFQCRRRPTLGVVEEDPVASALSRARGR